MTTRVPPDSSVFAAAPAIEIELFGVPRLLTGRREVTVHGESLAAAIAALGRQHAALVGPVIDPGTGWLVAGYVCVVDEVFTHDAGHPLSPGSTVLLVSSVAGG